jgi:hypothetical protein
MSDDRTFVSYSRADSQFAVKLASDLRANGAKVWIDQLDIAAGARWDDAIEEALRRSARVIVLLSPKSAASQNVMDEVSFALDEGKTIVPVLVERCTIPMRLRRLQYVDFTPGYDTALERLLVTLEVAETSVSGAATPAGERPRAEPRPSPLPPAAEPAQADQPALTSTTGDDGRRRVMLLGGAGVTAAIILVALLAMWGGGTSSTPTDPPESTVSAPTDAPPAASTTTPEPAPAEGAASRAVRQAETGASLEALDGVLGTQTAGAGLQALRQIVRELTGRSGLSEAELRKVADAQMAACEGLGDARCKNDASEQVTLLLSMVCRRQSGRAPSAADAMATLKYDTAVGACEQTYSSTVLDHFNSKALDAIRIRKD